MKGPFAQGIWQVLMPDEPCVIPERNPIVKLTCFP